MLAGAFAQGGLAQAAKHPIATGPAIGAHVPQFEAPDQDGKEHTLQSLMGPKGAILIFYRSADW